MIPYRGIGFLTICLAIALGLNAEPLEICVTGDRVNLRATAFARAEVVGQMMSGDVLTTPEPLCTGAWVRVFAPASVDLWVYSDLILDQRVAVNKAQVRAGPGLQFQRVGQLQQHTALDIRGTKGDWTRIAPTTNCFLWISRDYVIPVVDEVEAPAVEPSATDDLADIADKLPAMTNAVPASTVEKEAVVEQLPAPETMASQRLAEAASTPPAVTAVTAQAVELPSADAQPLTPQKQPPQLPLALGRYLIDHQRAQNTVEKFTGRLTPVPRNAKPRFCSYQIVTDSPWTQRREVLCRLLGMEGQLHELRSALVEVEGPIWHLVGQPYPVVEARRLLRLSPP